MRSLLLLLVPLLGLGALACGGPDTPPALPRPPDPGPAASTAPIASAAPAAPTVKNEDFLYLEEVSGEKALGFARAHNAVSEKGLTSDGGFSALEKRLFSIYSSKARIPSPTIVNDSLRNFW